MGKTRLGLAVAEAALADFEDGVWFVPLANVVKADEIPANQRRRVGNRIPVDEAMRVLGQRSIGMYCRRPYETGQPS